MSADYETEDLKGYGHPDFVHFAERLGGDRLIDLDWRTFTQIQTIMRAWRADMELQRRLSTPGRGRKCPECGHQTARHTNGSGRCSVNRCHCPGFEGDTEGSHG